MVQTTLKRSGMDHTAFNLERTPSLPLPRKHSPDGASTECDGEHLIASNWLWFSYLCDLLSADICSELATQQFNSFSSRGNPTVVLAINESELKLFLDYRLTAINKTPDYDQFWCRNRNRVSVSLYRVLTYLLNHMQLDDNVHQLI